MCGTQGYTSVSVLCTPATPSDQKKKKSPTFSQTHRRTNLRKEPLPPSPQKPKPSPPDIPLLFRNVLVHASVRSAFVTSPGVDWLIADLSAGLLHGIVTSRDFLCRTLVLWWSAIISTVVQRTSRVVLTPVITSGPAPPAGAPPPSPWLTLFSLFHHPPKIPLGPCPDQLCPFRPASNPSPSWSRFSTQS
ncbi:hypothetical protein PDE_05322 [Penicillium oxalicum 114-2]|uniref:Uncharacterized protein n=1 Tax=Penicillium oxalicum (strain 114-2 / CGMCC 5302) TaxID=933388 RepID=S7ZP07_PENO1|nr:hypothetical protein PDE_05322 [Penicillium oxalicum 114-2]